MAEKLKKKGDLGKKRVLISGAGIAGLTTAFWLQKYGFEVIVIEKAPDLRLDGYMIDFFGPGFSVIEKMGLVSDLKKFHYEIDLNLINKKGEVKLKYDYRRLQEACDGRFMTFLRSDLEKVLYEKVKDLVEVRFDTSIKVISNNDNLDSLVTATFEDNKKEEFDFIVGADGFHSNTRKLVFQEKDAVSKDFLNHYIVCFKLENDFEMEKEFYGYNQPGKQIALYPLKDGDLAAFFLFRSENLGRLSSKEIEQLVKEKFSDSGWKFPEVIQRVENNNTLFFDNLTQISMPKWYKNKVVLVGDAFQCLTLVSGQGASMACSGGYLLGKAMNEWLNEGGNSQEIDKSFQKYQDWLRPETEEKRQKAKKIVNSFAPNSKWKIFLRDLFLRIFFFKPFVPLLKRALGVDDFLKKKDLL